MKLTYSTIISKGVVSVFLIVIVVYGMSCKKLIEVEAPVTSTNAENVYTSDATAAAVLTGIYTNMSQSSFTNGIISLSLLPSLSADELTLFDYPNQNVALKAYYSNAMSANNAGIMHFWNSFYSTIFVANSAIEGLSKSESLTQDVKSQLIGESKFIRAFCYFYLVNLYGDVPLAVSSNYEINRLLTRTPSSEVYQQIVNDLKDAKELLKSDYVRSNRSALYPITNAERIHPNKSCATALLSRTYLYLGDYSNAESQATELISNKNFYDTVSINAVFIKNNKEAIWQLQPVTASINTQDARMFVLPTSGPNVGSNPVYLSKFILNDFENNDKRRTNWVSSVTVGSNTYFFPYKYKVANISSAVSEYTSVFRLAEQYLIRSEARAHLGRLNEGADDLNLIRARAGLMSVFPSDKNSLLTAIEKERRVELFTEWGHRWLDLKRWNRINSVMSSVVPEKNGKWSMEWALYPIPQYEFDKNPNLNGQQNPGY